MKKILVTGGSGFIGENLIKKLIENNQYRIFNLDKLSYASKWKSKISKSFGDLYTPLNVDLINKLDVEGAVAIGSTYSGTSTAPTNGLLVEGSTVIGTEDSNNLQDSNKLIVAGNVKFLNPADDSEFLSATVNNFTLGSVLNIDLGTGNTGIGTIIPTNKLVESSEIAQQEWRKFPAPARGQLIRQFGNKFKSLIFINMTS